MILKRNTHPTIILPVEEEDDNNVVDDYHATIDHHFIGMALQQARYAEGKGEVPIGAVIVRECTDDDNDGDSAQILSNAAATSSSTTIYTNNGQSTIQPRRTFRILSAAHNLVETNMDASAHAELLALRRGAQNLRNWRYPPNTRLYSTLEPCPMCLASIQAFRIDHIVYGAPDHRLGAIHTHMDLLNVAKHPYHEVKSTTGGIRESECGEIVKHFFRERRQAKKEEKLKKGGHDDEEQALLKLTRQNRKPPPWMNDLKQKVPFSKEQLGRKEKKMNMGNDDGQQILLKLPRRRNCNQKSAYFRLARFMNAFLRQ